MIPTKFVKLKPDDILDPKENNEYHDGKRSSFVGWLKVLFLYGPWNKGEYIEITPEDRKHYKKACSIIRDICGLKKIIKNGTEDGDIHELEYSLSKKESASIINKVVKKMSVDKER